MLHFIHLLGSYPLLVGFLSQVVVLLGAIKSKEKPMIAQAAVLMLALGLTTTSILLRPKSPPILAADLLGCVAAVCLLAPAVETARKQWKAKQKASEGAEG